jgi:hypothetical protein
MKDVGKPLWMALRDHFATHPRLVLACAVLFTKLTPFYGAAIAAMRPVFVKAVVAHERSVVITNACVRLLQETVKVLLMPAEDVVLLLRTSMRAIELHGTAPRAACLAACIE